jgi:hypothetical protein
MARTKTRRRSKSRARKTRSAHNRKGWTFSTERVGSGQYLGYAVDDDNCREVGPYSSAAAALKAAKAKAGKGKKRSSKSRRGKSKARRSSKGKRRSSKGGAKKGIIRRIIDAVTGKGGKKRASKRRSSKSTSRKGRARKVKTFGYGVSKRRGRPWVKKIAGFSHKHRYGTFGEKIAINPRGRRGRKSRRNPGIQKHLRDGGIISIEGRSVTVSSPHGESHDYEVAGAAKLLRGVTTTAAAHKALGSHGMLRSINPKRRKGRKSRRNCGRNPSVKHRGYKFRGARGRKSRRHARR